MLCILARSCATRFLLPGTLALLAVSGARAQPDHVPLAVSESLSFAEIFDSALDNAPESLETPVRADQARDYAATGRSLIAGQPSLQLSFYDDGPMDNVGLQEIEYGVQLPLWRPGQKRDARRLGQSYEKQVAVWETALSWTVVGRVRRVLMDIAAAEEGLALQAQAVADAQRLREVTETLFNAGEVARLELMQAEKLLVENQADMLQAEAAMVDAERAYAVVSGLQTRPALALAETRTPQEDIDADHPWLQYLRSNVEVADALIRQTEHNTRGNPTLTLGSRQERPDRFQTSISSVAIQFSMPFGGKNYVSSRTSNARRDKVDAEVAWQNARIQLNQSLHEVEHDLFILDQEEPLRRAQAQMSRQRFDMALTAFSLGEITLAQVVIAQQEAQESERALQMLLLERRRQTSEFNQLIGVMP